MWLERDRGVQRIQMEKKKEAKTEFSRPDHNPLCQWENGERQLQASHSQIKCSIILLHPLSLKTHTSTHCYLTRQGSGENIVEEREPVVLCLSSASGSCCLTVGLGNLIWPLARSQPAGLNLPSYKSEIRARRKTCLCMTDLFPTIFYSSSFMPLGEKRERSNRKLEIQ